MGVENHQVQRALQPHDWFRAPVTPITGAHFVYTLFLLAHQLQGKKHHSREPGLARHPTVDSTF